MLIGRFGGEEFLAYAKVENLNEARELAETIRQTVSNLNLTYIMNNTQYKITVSVGGKISDKDNHDINTLLRAADDSLYMAKKLGRNQVVVT